MKDIILNLEKKLFAKIELEKDKFLSKNYYNKETKNLFCVFDMDTKHYNSLLARINMIIKHEFEQLLFDLMIEYGYVSNYCCYLYQDKTRLIAIVANEYFL